MIVDLRSGSEINPGSETLANIRMHISALNSLLIVLEAVPATASRRAKPRLLNYSWRSTVERLHPAFGFLQSTSNAKCNAINYI